MSVQRRAAGDRNLDWLVERIRDEEVGALRFVGCRIEGTSNIFTFEELTRVPDKPWLIGEAGQPPVPASLDWTGEMLVEGTRTPVKLYRQPRPGVSAAPSDSLVLAREFPSDPVAFPRR